MDDVAREGREARGEEIVRDECSTWVVDKATGRRKLGWSNAVEQNW